MKPVLLLSLLLPASAAFAQGGLGEADADKDGKVDSKELKTYVSGKLADFDRFGELMTELDKDKDGVLSEEEFGGRMQAIQTIRQRPRPKPEPAKKESLEFAEMYEQIFSKKKPMPGDIVDAELSAFDENGNQFKFGQTRGKYTVIVFGCLT